MRRDPSQPIRIVQCLREPFGVTQERKDALVVAQRQQGITELEAHVDALSHRLGSLGEMWHGIQRLLKAGHRFLVCRPCHGLRPRLPTIVQRLVPHLAPPRMVRQPLDLLRQTIS
jgi:hypothetical protein